MSLAGFKKQLNKANQLFSEKVTGATGTQLDHDFVEMERKMDVAGKMIEDLLARTQEYLQPNPVARSKIQAMRALNNMQNKSKNMMYPQPEGVLGEAMSKYGKEMGHDSVLGSALIEGGESYKQMAEIKYNLEDTVKQNFLDPFSSLQQRELKEINHHRRKLEGRRLDFDCKKRKGGGKVSDDEMHQAEEKFVESKNLAENAMINFLNSDAEHIAALYEFVSAEKQYHQEASKILGDLQDRLDQKRSEAASQPKTEHVPTRPTGVSDNRQNDSHDSWKLSASDSHQENHQTSPSIKPAAQWDTHGHDAFAAKANGTKVEGDKSSATATCRALYTFAAENATELPFEEGDIIKLLTRVDENWYEGEIKGKRGYFPQNYVEIIVPLP